MMSATGTALIVITVLILKPFWNDVQGSYLPIFPIYDRYPPLYSSTPEPITMPMQLPCLSVGAMEFKRQFDPWGGKKRTHVEEKISKRQFSPWGGKRTYAAKTENVEEHTFSGPSLQQKSPFKKRGFKSWASKKNKPTNNRNFNVWEGKHKLLSWDGKRFSNLDSLRIRESIKQSIYNGNFWNNKSFNSWEGKRSSNSQNNKGYFNSWGGKRM